MESPPKRITRARAAAKSDDTSSKQTRVVTAATRARAAGSATASTKSTVAKRKTRADENENEDDNPQQATTRRALRARSTRPTETQEEASATVTTTANSIRGRTRIVKKPAIETINTKDAAAETVAVQPRPRGRPRKTPVVESNDQPPELVKKTTRTRATSTVATKPNTASAKPAVKKTVKFQEPDKENMEPQTKAKEPVTSGLRGRPARRGGAATSAVRGTTKTTSAQSNSRKKPLSPRKVTQLPVTRDGDSSEDELAAEKAKSPVKPMMMSPIKPPSGVMVSTKKREPVREEADPIGNQTASSQDEEPGASSSLVSPPRRFPSSPVKDSLKSPAKRIGSNLAESGSGTSNPLDLAGQASAFKASLLQSAAKRPQSPIKGLTLPSISATEPLQTQSAVKKTLFQSPAKRAMPGWKPMTEPRLRGTDLFAGATDVQSLAMMTPSRATTTRPSSKLMIEEEEQDGDDGDDNDDSDREDGVEELIESTPFSGRLSSVLPRHADPALQKGSAEAVEEDKPTCCVHELSEVSLPVEMAQESEVVPALSIISEPSYEGEGGDDPMAIDDIVAEMEDSAELTPQPQELVISQSREQFDPKYQLREKDTDPCHDLQSDSDSEDEWSSPSDHIVPTPARPAHTPGRSVGDMEDSRRTTIGLSSLAEQLGSWSAASPFKPIVGARRVSMPMKAFQEDTRVEPTAFDEALAPEESPFKSSFFDDEMLAHPNPVAEINSLIAEACEEGDVEDPGMDGIMVTEEDVALAQEANEMSIMEPQQIDAVVNGQSFDDGLSEASQEYGDENQVPPEQGDDYASLAPVTPARPQLQTRTFYTTTKVPLKPADESTPSPLKKRSWSVGRVTTRRPGSLSRSATVISYSPTKDKKRGANPSMQEALPSEPVTPAKSDIWSSIGTPARTPRRDVDASLLRGAVVFVDVHTTEGADASGIFVELLTQMGARCVKTWQWNPSTPTDGESSSNKVGITHVVYKDGGKRTLEKVRWANGLVQCVGVSWVLDCERENEWLDEAAYYIDTSNMPRGGARRRKSMEPKALANLNGTVVSSPAKGASKTPATPANRRDSTLWMHTPSDQDEEEVGDDDEDLEWSCVLLTPVPKTPAPEAIARYAAELPETPGGAEEEDMDSPMNQAHVTRTCPPKQTQYRDLGEGILTKDKDEHVLMRLMAARRKSLQFAPKIGSPLSKTWG